MLEQRVAVGQLHVEHMLARRFLDRLVAGLREPAVALANALDEADNLCLPPADGVDLLTASLLGSRQLVLEAGDARSTLAELDCKPLQLFEPTVTLVDPGGELVDPRLGRRACVSQRREL